VNFTGSVGLGNNAAADTLTVESDLNLAIGNQTAGFVLTCLDVDGSAAWVQPAATGVTSVNSKAGPTVILDAADVGAVSVAYSQEITGAKTFSNNVTLGTASNDIIYIGGELQIPDGENGQVLTSSAGNKVIWQTPEPAGVTSFNGATGPITLTALDLDALTLQTLPVASSGVKGIMRVGGGLTIDGAGIVSVSQNATLPIAGVGPTGALGGIRIGDNLSINATTGVLSAGITGTSGVTSFKGRTGPVTPEAADYTAAQVTNAVDTNTAQDITASKKFTTTQSVTTSNTNYGVSGTSGVFINPNGLLRAQRPLNDDHVFEGVSPTGGTTSFIEADGDAQFSGLVTANGGFHSNAGVTFGDNTNDGINLTGTLKFTGGGTPLLDKVMTCKDSLGTVAWEYPLNAPVTTVNGTNGSVSISLYGEASPTANLGGVSLATAQVISGTKTFSANQIFQANVNLGNDPADVITVGGTLVIANGAGNGKVLTCNGSNQGVWTVPIITTVGTQIGAGAIATQTGAVVITADLIGAATTGALATLTSQVTAASQLATNAKNAADAATATAATKLSSVTITTTLIDTIPVSCLSGLGTGDSPLKVLGASPLGVAGGDLTSSYPSPTIGANKVTYGKMQQVSTGSRLLGNAAAGTTAANVTEISLGAGLGFDGGQLKNTAIPTVSATGTNIFTGANTFQGNVVVGDAAGDALTVNATMSTVAPVTLGSASGSTSQITVHGPLKITSGTPVAGKFLTTDASGNTSWAEPVVPPQWTINHYLAEQQLFGRWNAIDTNPGQQQDTVARGSITSVALSTMTAGMYNKWRVSTGSTSGGLRQVDLVIAAGQSCYFGQLVSSHADVFESAVGVTLSTAPTSITASGTTIGSSYAGLTPTLHTGPKTVTVYSPGAGRNGWFSVFRVS
jgi:hypothetical protein